MHSTPDILRAAAKRLRAAPLSPKFALKERLSGALIDVNALRGRGWRLLTTMKDGDPELWCNSLWIERTIVVEKAEPFLVHISFGPNVENVDKAMAGRAPFPAYLRRVHIFCWKNGGLTFDVPTDTPPPALFHQLSLELGEAVLEKRPSMLLDMDRLTDGYDVDLPPAVWPSDFARQLAIIQIMAWNEWKDDQHDGAERLLVPILSVLAHPGSDTEAETLLRESTDGNTLWRILFVWLNVADDNDAVRHYIAFLIERALSGELAEPLGMDGWSTLSMGLQQMGEGVASLAAMEYAAKLGKDNPDFPKSLWMQARQFANALGRLPEDKPLDGLRDLIRILVSNEDILATMDGYWSLLGLAFLLNGEKSDLYLGRMKKALVDEILSISPENPAKSNETEKDKTEDANPFDLMRPRFLANPLGWQSFLIGVRGDARSARRQLAVFPTPILESPADPHAFPVVPILGVSPGDVWRCIDPDIVDHVDDMIDDIRSTGHPIGDADVLHPSMDELEISDENAFFITRLLQPPARRCEITSLLVSGVRIDDPKRPDFPFCIIPLARPAGSPKNAVLSAWRLFPYRDNGCGEAMLHLPDGRPLGAILPFFASDRHLLPRGVPCPAFVFATGIEVQVEVGADRIGDDNMRGFCFLNNVEQEATRAYYEAAAIVRSVRRVRFFAAGEHVTVLRLDLDVGNSLPFPIPLYIHPSKASGKNGTPQRGDIISARLLLHADLFNPEPATLRAWRRAHPHGPGKEPFYKEPPFMSVLETFRKVKKEELKELRQEAKEAIGENDEKGDDEDDIEPLTPENLDAVQAALGKLRNALGPDNCVRWSDNPSRTDIAALVDGSVRRYRVFLRRDDDPPPTASETPPGIEPLIVRVIDRGDTYKVAYEGLPIASQDELPF